MAALSNGTDNYTLV